MVRVVVYVEGGTPPQQHVEGVLTIDNSSIFREHFHQLLSQKFDPNLFDLVVQPIGSVTRVKALLEMLNHDQKNSAILIDLDGPESVREDRLKHFAPLDTAHVFFMVQEMEAWILAQITVLEDYAHKEGYIRKHPLQSIEDDKLLSGRHPESISRPSEKLNTIFRKYYTIGKVRKGKLVSKPKSYQKSKDGPSLIGILSLEKLESVFQDVANLINHLHAGGDIPKK
jgi:hypothetical protein